MNFSAFMISNQMPSFLKYNLLVNSLGSRHWEVKGKKGLLEELVAQLSPTLCDPMNCSLPDSSVHGILLPRILEWVAISSSKGSSWPRDQTWVSYTVGRFFAVWATRKAQEYWSGLPFSSPGDLPDPGITPGSLTLEAGSLPSEPPGKSLRESSLHESKEEGLDRRSHQTVTETW